MRGVPLDEDLDRQLFYGEDDITSDLREMAHVPLVEGERRLVATWMGGSNGAVLYLTYVAPGVVEAELELRRRSGGIWYNAGAGVDREWNYPEASPVNVETNVPQLVRIEQYSTVSPQRLVVVAGLFRPESAKNLELQTGMSRTAVTINNGLFIVGTDSLEEVTLTLSDNEGNPVWTGDLFG